jgi:hypothetical protein
MRKKKKEHRLQAQQHAWQKKKKNQHVAVKQDALLANGEIPKPKAERENRLAHRQ